MVCVHQKGVAIVHYRAAIGIGVGIVVALVAVLFVVRPLERQDAGEPVEPGEIVWKRSAPADLALSGRPQLVEFFHPL
jgi:hypothetical protein